MVFMNSISITIYEKNTLASVFKWLVTWKRGKFFFGILSPSPTLSYTTIINKKRFNLPWKIHWGFWSFCGSLLLAFSIDGLRLCWFSCKTTHAYISGRQNKKKNWKKNTWKVLNRLNWVPTSLYTIFVSVTFRKNMPDRWAAFAFTNRRSTTFLQCCCIPSAKQYP